MRNNSTFLIIWLCLQYADAGVIRLNATLSGDCTRIKIPGQSSPLLACNSVFQLELNSESSYVSFLSMNFLVRRSHFSHNMRVLNCRIYREDSHVARTTKDTARSVWNCLISNREIYLLSWIFPVEAHIWEGCTWRQFDSVTSSFDWWCSSTSSFRECFDSVDTRHVSCAGRDRENQQSAAFHEAFDGCITDVPRTFQTLCGE